MEYASKGVAGAGLGLGIAGTALSLLNGGVNLMGMSAAPAAAYYGDRQATWHDVCLLQELMTEKQRSAILEAATETDKKLVEVYAKLESRDKEIWDKIDRMRREQEAVNREQAVYNGVNTATVRDIRRDVDILLEMAPRKIRNESICPGWGPVEVTPVDPT